MAATVQGSATAVCQQEQSMCPTCGETITQQFCPACGEHCFDRHSFSFRHFLHHLSQELFDFDSRIIRTIRYLFSKPAFVTSEYLAGKKSRYVNPLRLYVICFALSALLTSWSPSFLDIRTVLKNDLTGSAHKSLARVASMPLQRSTSYHLHHCWIL